MVKKIILFLITVYCLSAANVFASIKDNNDHTPEPYDMTKVPDWAKEIRRTEIITFGTLPFVTLGVALGFSIADYVQHNFDANYFPNPFAKSESFTTEKQLQIIGISCLISVGLGLTNLIVNIIKYQVQKKKMKSSGNITVKDTSTSLQFTVPERTKRPKDYLFGNIESAVY